MAREVEHEITVGAPARELYRLISEVENWPRIFPPTVFVDHLERGAREERITIWATANGEPARWTSRRVLDPKALRVDFRQEVSSPPIAGMGGAWIVEPLGEEVSRVRLLHDYRVVDDDPRSLARVDAAVDRNSRSELAALKRTAESASGTAEATLSFEDSVRVNGSAKDVYDFLNEAQRWPERLPHVAEVALTEHGPGLQTLRLDTLARDGSTHVTESVRVCFPHRLIAYKQTTLPALLRLHTGYWKLTEGEDGTTTATSQHTVVLDTDSLTAVLGPRAGLAEARKLVRASLGGNSAATLAHAKAYAERHGPGERARPAR